MPAPADPTASPFTVVLAHGAGAPMDSPFLERMAALLAGHGIAVARFEFPYMARRRADGARRAPDREPVLRTTWREVATLLGGGPRLVVGGKSMGGRIATMVADEIGAAGVVCLGYPFHPPGRPDRLRTRHLATLATPALFVQGTRDVFGSREEVEGYALSPAIRLHWIEDGDHSLAPRKRVAGRGPAEAMVETAAVVAEFVAALPPPADQPERSSDSIA